MARASADPALYPAGEYRIDVESSARPAYGPYSFTVVAGTITTTQVNPVFTTGVQEVGSPVEVHVYQFTVAADVYRVVNAVCDEEARFGFGTPASPPWLGGGCDAPYLHYFQAEVNQLWVTTSTSGDTGYQISVEVVPEPDLMPVTCGTLVNGELESIGAVDIFEFTVSTPGWFTFDGDDCPAGTTATIQSDGAPYVISSPLI